MELKGELRGPGYNVDSYVGAHSAVQASLVDNIALSFAAVAAEAATNRRPPLPPFRQKPMKFSDPTGMLSHGGAHMPLAVFVGGATSIRSPLAIERRSLMRPVHGHMGHGDWAGHAVHAGGQGWQ